MSGIKSPLLEKHKKPGVHYALTWQGIELPIVDVTHPAFALKVTQDEQRALVEEFVRSGTPFQQLPKALRGLVLRFFLRGSVLAHGIQRSQGTFMSGMDTYLLKLGPDMLGDAYAKQIDRRIAGSLPVLGVRLRLQDMAELMAEELFPALKAEPKWPLCFINIAGGPAIDSLNTLILLNKRLEGIHADRSVSINVLDADEEGPAFGEAALKALSSERGPLAGLRIEFRRVAYDWAQPSGLHSVLGRARSEGAIAICSSEGGLFEYGSDEEIEGNLRVLQEYDEVVAVAGSVTRADEPAKRLREANRAALRPRGIEIFRALVQKAGWTVSGAIERPFSDQVVLT